MLKNSFNNYIDIDSLDLFIKEIEEDLDNKRYLSALHLALSIPDMLGKLFYKENKVRERYIKWFDEYVNNEFGLTSNQYMEIFPCNNEEEFKKEKSYNLLRLDGVVCYELRCKLFHEGHDDIKDIDINEFVISFSDDDILFGDCGGIDYEALGSYLYISCKGLCRDIVKAAIEFKKNNPELEYPKLRINNGGGHISNKSFV